MKSSKTRFFAKLAIEELFRKTSSHSCICAGPDDVVVEYSLVVGVEVELCVVMEPNGVVMELGVVVELGVVIGLSSTSYMDIFSSKLSSLPLSVAESRTNVQSKLLISATFSKLEICRLLSVFVLFIKMIVLSILFISS